MKAKPLTGPGKSITFYFQVHQPRRLRHFDFFSIGSHGQYFDDNLNEDIVVRIARECYLPTNAMLLGVIRDHPALRLSFSISGTALDQFARYVPEVISSFKALAETGSVEFLCETNYHSLASLVSREEFQAQVVQHAEKLFYHFGVRPSVFRNTELIYNDAIGSLVASLGFRGIVCDGVDHALGLKTTYSTYSHPYDPLGILVRSNSLSDDIAFRYGSGKSKLSPSKYLSQLSNLADQDNTILLAMDYETFGEHYKANSGIRNFLKGIFLRTLRDKQFRQVTPSEALAFNQNPEPWAVEKHISWADAQKDLSAWLGNDMQKEAFELIRSLGDVVLPSGDEILIDTWRNLQTSDHFYYMSTKKYADGNAHAYFSHYASPYEAFINYMNVVSDLRIAIQKLPAESHVVAEQMRSNGRHAETKMSANNFSHAHTM